jgi:hypothetical protein
MSKAKKNQPSSRPESKPLVKEPKINISAWLEDKRLPFIIAGSFFVIMLLISFGYHKVGDYNVETDFFWSYVPQGQSFFSGDIVIDKYRGPLYPIVLAIFSVIFGGNYFNAGVFIAVLSASLVLFLTFKLIKQIFNSKIALAATLIVAINKVFIQYTYSAGTDMFFNIIALSAFYFLFSYTEQKKKYLIIAGLFTALAYLTRYNGVFIIVSAFVFILFFNLYKTTFVKRLIAFGLYTGVFLLLIAPWGYYTKEKTGKAFFNENYQNIAFEYIAKDNNIGWDEFWYTKKNDYTSVKDIILKEPTTFFSKFFSNIFSHLKEDLGNLMGWQIGIFSILGLIAMFFKFPDSRKLSYLLLNVFFFGILLLIFYTDRFSLFLIPFYAVLAANFFLSENTSIGNLFSKQTAGFYAIWIILIIWTLAVSVKFNSVNIGSGDKNIAKVAKWFKKNVPESERKDQFIIARKPHVAYYMGLKYHEFPYVNSYDSLISLLKERKIKYLYYGGWEYQSRNQFKDLLEKPGNYYGLTYLVGFTDRKFGPCELYKVTY